MKVDVTFWGIPCTKNSKMCLLLTELLKNQGNTLQATLTNMSVVSDYDLLGALGGRCLDRRSSREVLSPTLADDWTLPPSGATAARWAALPDLAQDLHPSAAGPAAAGSPPGTYAIIKYRYNHNESISAWTMRLASLRHDIACTTARCLCSVLVTWVNPAKTG